MCGRRAAIVVAVLSFAGVLVLWRVFVDTLAGQQVENAAFQGALYGQTQLWRVAERVLDVVSVGAIAPVLIAAMLIAAVRRRWSLAVQVAVLMIGANLTTRCSSTRCSSGRTSASRPATATRCPAVTPPRPRRCRRRSCSWCPPRVRPWAAVLGARLHDGDGRLDAHRSVAPAVGRRRGGARRARVDRDRVRARRADSRAAVDHDRRAPASIGPDPDTRHDARGALGARHHGGRRGGSAAVALSHTWNHSDDLSARAEQVTAYLGGAAGALMTSCLAFAVMLVLRQAAASRLPRG